MNLKLFKHFQLVKTFKEKILKNTWFNRDDFRILGPAPFVFSNDFQIKSVLEMRKIELWLHDSSPSSFSPKSVT